MVDNMVFGAEVIFRGGPNPQRHVIIDLATCPIDPQTGQPDLAQGKVTNVVTWDPVAEPDWKPEPGFVAVRDDTREITAGPPVIPVEITNANGRLALIQAGLFDQVDAMAEAAGRSSPFYTLWNFAPSWKRQSSTINAMANQLGLSQHDVDMLFIAAAQIET